MPLSADGYCKRAYYEDVRRRCLAMVDSYIIRKQLQRIKADQSFWGKPELAELPKILIDGEVIEHLQYGYYKGGFATLCATNHRLLLIDKKTFFLIVEDIRYDMIAEVDYGHQFIGAVVHIRSFSKDFKFQSLNKEKLRDITHFIQHKVMELRGHQTGRQLGEQLQPQSQPIPMQVFETGNSLTDSQADSLVPLSQEAWYKLNPDRKLNNPYTQTPLVSRRRVGRYGFAKQ